MSGRGPGVNLEVKARDPSPADTGRACLRLGAREVGTLRQRDTYFHARGGRLKLREDLGSGTAELIAYERPDDEGVRTSSYVRVPVPAAADLSAALEAALGVVVVVEKQRRLLLYENVRIHLDDVAGLGTFVELESVLSAPDGSESDAERDAFRRVRTALGMDVRETVAGSYADLLAQARAPRGGV